MTNLFEKGPLQQDTGILSERWGQSGSTPVDIAASVTGDTTLRTVTANKTFYCTGYLYSNSSADSGNFLLRDGGAAGTIRLAQSTNGVVGDGISVNFSSPLIFETDVYFDEVVAIGVNITLTGWEE